MVGDFRENEARGPLDGLLVVDLTRVLAGPYCTLILYDLGARIIKVERPRIGDDSRHIGPFLKEKSAYFMSLNRGKESIALDLKDGADRNLFEEILSKADILVENYRPGTMEKLGLGWDDLHKKFPRLIYAAASGFGHTGPYAEKPAYDMVVQAMGGVMSLTGRPGDPPVRVGTSIGDLAAGMFTAIGVQAALSHLHKTGEGSKVDVSMLDCQVALLENAIARYFATGTVPGPLGSRHPSITPFQAFQTADHPIVIAAGNDSLFRRLGETIGAAHMADDERYKTNALRAENVDALEADIEAHLTKRPSHEWLPLLESAGVPCGPINSVDQVLSDPQIKARNMVVHAEDPDVGSLGMAGNPIKLSAYGDPTTRPAAPDLDADRAAILASLGIEEPDGR